MLKTLWRKIKLFFYNIYKTIKEWLFGKENNKEDKVEGSVLIIYNKLCKVSKNILYKFNKK